VRLGDNGMDSRPLCERKIELKKDGTFETYGVESIIGCDLPIGNANRRIEVLALSSQETLCLM